MSRKSAVIGIVLITLVGLVLLFGRQALMPKKAADTQTGPISLGTVCYRGENIVPCNDQAQSTSLQAQVTTHPVNLSDRGSRITAAFHLNSASTTFTVSYSGSDRIVVRLLDDSGNSVKTIVDNPGPVNAKVVYNVGHPGIYRLNIQANETWSVHIE